MSARRYRTEIAGVVRVGLEFDSNEELESFLADRGLPASLPGAPVQRLDAEAEPRGRGRPSHNALIGSAVRALGAQLNGAAPLVARVRMVRRYLAETRQAHEIPGRSTVERFLRSQCVKNPAANPRQKSGRAKIAGAKRRA